MLVCLPVGSCPRCSACWPCWWCPYGRRCWSRPPRPCPRPPDHPYQGVVYWEGCCSSRNGSRVRIPESGSRLTVNSFPSDLRLKIENVWNYVEKIFNGVYYFCLVILSGTDSLTLTSTSLVNIWYGVKFIWVMEAHSGSDASHKRHSASSDGTARGVRFATKSCA